VFTLELKDAKKTVTIETDVSLDLLHDRVGAFVAALDALDRAVPLASFLGSRVVGSPLVYSYSFVTKDGRTWNQEISFVSGVKMTFNVPTAWKLSEFVPHRAVRDEFVLLVRDFGLETAEVTYA